MTAFAFGPDASDGPATTPRNTASVIPLTERFIDLSLNAHPRGANAKTAPRHPAAVRASERLARPTPRRPTSAQRRDRKGRLPGRRFQRSDAGVVLPSRAREILEQQFGGCLARRRGDRKQNRIAGYRIRALQIRETRPFGGQRHPAERLRVDLELIEGDQYVAAADAERDQRVLFIGRVLQHDRA